MGLSSIDRNRSILSGATDVANFADFLEIKKFSIIGHSGGGPFVAACAYAIRQRLNGAAIISGMAPFEKPESQVGMARGQRIANKVIKAMPWLSPIMMRLTLIMLKSPNKMMAQMIKQLPEVDQLFYCSPDNTKPVINSTLEAFRKGVVGPFQEMRLLLNPWGFDLEDVKYPVTIWHGALDTQVPLSNGAIYADLIPGAQLEIFKNEGHLSLIKNHIEKF